MSILRKIHRFLDYARNDCVPYVISSKHSESRYLYFARYIDSSTTLEMTGPQFGMALFIRN